MIKEAIEEYQKSKDILGEGADRMEFGVKRNHFIEIYKEHLSKTVQKVAEWLYNTSETIGKEHQHLKSEEIPEYAELDIKYQKMFFEFAERILDPKKQ